MLLVAGRNGWMRLDGSWTVRGYGTSASRVKGGQRNGDKLQPVETRLGQPDARTEVHATLPVARGSRPEPCLAPNRCMLSVYRISRRLHLLVPYTAGHSAPLDRSPCWLVTDHYYFTTFTSVTTTTTITMTLQSQ